MIRLVKPGMTIALILAATLLGLILRLPRLAERPMHCDEAVHAIKFNTLWQTGGYVYDPSEYHGPTLYYFALPLAWLSGAKSFADLSEATLRLTPVIFGILLISLHLLVRDGLGSGAVIFSAFLAALSPAFVYYSRYYIQEVMLVCFTFAAIALGWRWWSSKNHKVAWAIATGTAIGLMHGTKETCAIAWGAAGCSVLIARLLIRSEPAGDVDRAMVRRPDWIALGLAALSAAVVSISLFTAFFQNWRGPLDSLLTYKTYFDRAGNHGLHNHPPDFYWDRILWWRFSPAPLFSEGVIIMAGLLGMFAILRNRDRSKPRAFQLFVLWYTILLTAIYTLIPYKTPWCALGFLHGWILLAGVGLNWAFNSLVHPASRTILALASLAGAAWLFIQSDRAISRRFAADHRNPYVYAHTVNDLLDLGVFVEKVATARHDDPEFSVHVFATDDDFWPLPWYLRRLDHVGYWDTLIAKPDADVVVLSLDLQEQFEAAKAGTYPLIGFYGLRPGVQLAVYVSAPAWEAFRAGQPRVRPAPSEATDERE